VHVDTPKTTWVFKNIVVVEAKLILVDGKGRA
jgi:hypothetical protein